MKKLLFFAAILLASVPAHASVRELIESVKQKNLAGVLELLDSGEDVNVANEQGNTALHYAIAMDNADITQVLLAYGADLNAANLKGWTPLSIAKKKQVKNVAPIIEKELQQRKEKDATLQAAKQVRQKTVEKPVKAVEKQIEQSQINAASVQEKLPKIVQKNVAVEQKTTTIAKVKSQVQEQPKSQAQKSEAKPVVKKKAAVEVSKTAVKTPVVEKSVPKKKVLVKSKMNDKIYEGDEEIVYCLNYLGHGENESMLHGAGFFAASAGISEARYKQIADEVTSFLAGVTASDLSTRNNVCGQIITPKNKDKQNQIIRSINQGIGV